MENGLGTANSDLSANPTQAAECLMPQTKAVIQLKTNAMLNDI